MKRAVQPSAASLFHQTGFFFESIKLKNLFFLNFYSKTDGIEKRNPRVHLY